jgi:hypothetical protein
MTALLMVDGKKQSLRINIGRVKTDTVYSMIMHSFLTWNGQIMLHLHMSKNDIFM